MGRWVVTGSQFACRAVNGHLPNTPPLNGHLHPTNQFSQTVNDEQELVQLKEARKAEIVPMENEREVRIVAY
jgi:hypothetical protein